MSHYTGLFRHSSSSSSLNIGNQNVRGLTSGNEEEFSRTLNGLTPIPGHVPWLRRTPSRGEQRHGRRDRSKLHAVFIQETWRDTGGGTEESSINGCAMILAGERKKSCRRGRLGVVIMLGPELTDAWKRTGTILSFGPRHLLIRVVWKGTAVHLGSAYAPTTQAPTAERETFYEGMELDKVPSDGILVVGIDANASVGVRGKQVTREGAPTWRRREEGTVGAIGPAGLPHTNQAGREFVAWLEASALCLADSFFPRRGRVEDRHVGTWMHPQSGRHYVLDHFITNHDTRRKVCKAFGKAPAHFAAYSDHEMIMMRIQIEGRENGSGMRGRAAPHHRRTGTGGHPNLKPTKSGTAKGKPNLKSLQTREVKEHFQAVLEGKLDAPTAAGGMSQKMEAFTTALKETAEEVVPQKGAYRKEWYEADAKRLEKLKERLANAVKELRARPQSTRAKKLKANAVRRYRHGLRLAQQEWAETEMKELRKHPHGDVWGAAQRLIRGFSTAKQVQRMDKSAEEVKEHFTKNAFGIQSEGVDPTILEGMKQRDVAWELDAEPTDKEIDASIKQAKAGKSTVDGIYMDYYKAMEEHGTGRAVFRDLLKEIWRGEEDGLRVTAKPLPALPRWDSLSAWEKVEIATEMGLRISFLKENPKRKHSKSRLRYASYCQARTVQEALERGAVGGQKGDLVYDQEHGFLTIHTEQQQPEVNKTTVKEPAEKAEFPTQ